MSLQVFGDFKIPCETTQVARNTGPNVPGMRNPGCGRSPQASACVNKTKDEWAGNREGH